MKPKLFVAAKAFILNRGKVLIVRESKKHSTNTQAGHYGLPGGRLNPGEHFTQGLKREVKEETGLDITMDKPLLIGEWRPRVKKEQWQIIGIFFLCSAHSNQVQLSEEHDEYKWIKPEDFNQHDIIANEVAVFKAYLK